MKNVTTITMKKLNYLIVMPRFIQNAGDGYSFPLGIAYISSAMKKHGLNVFTLNLNHCDGNIEKILHDEIENNNINVVLTGGLSFQYNTLKHIVDVVNDIDPDVKQIVGGGIITADPITAMTALEHVDFGVIGEGEITICELADVLENGTENFKDVNGIVYKDVNYRITLPRKEIENLDEIPWPDYDGFNMEEYLKCSPGISGLNSDHTVFMISSRSCPFSCTFCFHTVGKKYRVRSMDEFFKS
jgi:radical SAM superfamily enzyme YgiQ (UPF0313 family)